MATITKLPSGKYRAQVRRKGVNKGRTFDRKQDAKDWAAEIEQAVVAGSNTGRVQAPSGVKVADLVEAYLRSVQINAAAHSSLRAVCRVIGTVPVRDLNLYHLQRWIDHRRKEGVTGATIAHNLGLISGLLKWAHHARQIDVDPGLVKEARASLSASRVVTTSVERDRLPTNAELDALRAFFPGQGKLKLPMPELMEFALVTGMRLGEITSITFEDWRQNEGAILVRDRKDPKAKIGNNQVVPLLPAANAIIEQRFRSGTGTGRVFPYRPNSVSSAWIYACDKLGIDDLHFHDLRHEAITRLFRLGLSIQEVALFSGHKTWTQLRRYTQLQPADIHQRLERLERLGTA